MNGKTYEYSYINHQDIIHGGNLVFEMTNTPSNWGTKDQFIPSTTIKEHLIVAAPFIANGKTAFKGSTKVELQSVQKDVEIFYSLDKEFQKYQKPFVISEKSTLNVYAQKGENKSAIIRTDFNKIDPNITIDLKTKYANQYNAGGDNALIDGIKGTEDFRTGTWQGYWNEDVIAIVDLGKQELISNVNVSFLRDQRSWIFLPKEVQIYTSSDGVNYTKGSDWKSREPINTEEVKIETILSLIHI